MSGGKPYLRASSGSAWQRPQVRGRLKGWTEARGSALGRMACAGRWQSWQAAASVPPLARASACTPFR